MITSFKEWLTSYHFISFIALYTYWIPLLVCSVVYFFRMLKLYRRDLKESMEKYYHPELTIGRIVWMMVLAITPCINIFAMVFDCSGSVFRWLGDVLDIPLVRHKVVTKD